MFGGANTHMQIGLVIVIVVLVVLIVIFSNLMSVAVRELAAVKNDDKVLRDKFAELSTQFKSKFSIA